MYEPSLNRVRSVLLGLMLIAMSLSVLPKSYSQVRGPLEGESDVRDSEFVAPELDVDEAAATPRIGSNQPFAVGDPFLGGSMNISTGSTDFAGEWYIIDSEERALGDSTGVPLNEAGRMRVETHNAAEWGIEEFQCRPHPMIAQWRASGAIRVQKEIGVDRALTAYHVNYVRGMDRPIYLDGRPHPPEYAPHTWAGFSTGRFVANALVVTTTHIKEGYFDWNGHEHSAQVKVTEWWIRHGDHLTVTVLHEDPIYLEEPFIQSISYRWDPHTELESFPCEVIQEIPSGELPHWLPGTNPYVTEFADRYGLPYDATRGGAKTMYPEYREQLQALMEAEASSR